MHKNIITFAFLLTIFTAFAQDLYLPIEYKQAYESGTRKKDGTVSDKYWQNRSVYNIKAKIDPVGKVLTGESKIEYFNNSPDSLNYIVFHAYHDYYKAGAAKAGFFSSGYNENLISDGMVLDLVKVADSVIDMKNRRMVTYNGTNYRIRLSTPLAPKSSIKLEINWNYSIPGDGFERSGAIDSTSMFIAYWYPEIAVLDDINGWDRITYDASTEFYHDNSDYTVEIEAPDNFLIWASVELSNKKEVFSKDILKRLERASNSENSVTIIGEKDIEVGVKLVGNKWLFEAKNFRDFSFAISDHFIWKACKYEDKFGKYFLNSAYPADHPHFSSVLKTQQESLRIFHNYFPAYPFPFQHFTIFNGLRGGGMEFPGMANNDDNSGEQFSNWAEKEVSDYEANLGLSLHEMFHMYFPFLMGINEKRYAWMDEGMANFADYFIPPIFDGNWDNSYLARLYVAPMMVQTYTTPQHAGMNSYTIGSYSYYSLYHLLGEDLFKKCMKEYMDRWKNKHPTPYDYFYTFNDATGMDLNWFWKRWYFDWGAPDLAIQNFENNELVIENSGGRPLAFKLTYTYADNTKSEENISPIVWKEKDSFSKKIDGDKEIVKIQLSILGGSDAILDNNIWVKD